LALSGTTTHDTKRSEDGRYRLHVLSELAPEWRAQLRSWSRSNGRTADHKLDPNHEYYFYQTLVAAWTGTVNQQFRDRMQAHMLKAIREAKDITSWTRPAPDYERYVESFINAVLRPRRDRFLERVARFCHRIEPAARLKSYAALTLKMLAPGVPDIYQGTELLDFSLTDPDNRRPIDYITRSTLLDTCDGQWPGARSILDPASKLALTAALISIRREHPTAMDGDYRRLQLDGSHHQRAFAFIRSSSEDTIAVILPVRASKLVDGEGRFPDDAWQDTSVTLPPGTWLDLLTGTEVTGPDVALNQLYQNAPIAVLRRNG
jgi:(1->4)-alpha-D-glucan 1-alpha-D-glucosylmutase